LCAAITIELFYGALRTFIDALRGPTAAVT
jgi:hypothetical protein